MALTDYQCTLDEKSVKKAIEELHENPNDRIAACLSLKEWIESQPHIKCATVDAEFLMTFMRGAKWSQLRAREMVEGYMLMKTEVPEWFRNLDPKEEKIMSIINSGYILPLPKRDPNGCQVVIYRMAQIDASFKGYSHADVFRVGMVFGAWASSHEMTQVNGVVFIFDFTGATLKQVTTMMQNKDGEKFHKKFQKNVPGRFKAFHYYNAGVFFDMLMQFARPFLPQKYKDRIRTHDTMESIYTVVPKQLFPIEYLPDDYKGPNAGTISDVIENYKRQICEDKFRQRLIFRNGDMFGIEESKRPTGATPITESFRKLNVD